MSERPEQKQTIKQKKLHQFAIKLDHWNIAFVSVSMEVSTERGENKKIIINLFLKHCYIFTVSQIFI